MKDGLIIELTCGCNTWIVEMTEKCVYLLNWLQTAGNLSPSGALLFD